MPEPTPDPQPQRPWPLTLILAAPLLAVIAPVHVARRLDHTHPALAWLVHATGVLMATALIFILAAWSDADLGASPSDIATGFQMLLQDLIPHPANHEQLLILAVDTAVAALLIEGLTLATGWLLSAPVARPEPWRQSLRRALVRLWLITPHACVHIGAMGAVTIWIQKQTEAWWQINQQPSTWIDPPLWLQRLSNVGPPTAFALLTLVLLIVLWRVFCSERWRACCRWPARCESCGYSLRGLPADRDCPECGHPVAASTRDSPRNRHPIRSLRTMAPDWFRAATWAIIRPGRLGRQLPTLSPAPCRGPHFALTAVGAFAIGTAGTTIAIWIEHLQHSPNAFDTAWQTIGTGLITGTATTLIVSALTLGGASIVGTSARLKTGRNLLAPAMDAALSLGGYLLLALTALWTWWLSLYLALDVFNLLDPHDLPDHYMIPLMLSTTFGPPVILLLIHLALLGTITRATRHANT